MFGLPHDDELLLHQKIAYAILIQTIFIFPLLYFVIPAPWGKTINYSLGPLVPARISWFVFESPNLAWSAVCWCNVPSTQRLDTAAEPLPIANQILMSFFALHYVQRAILYPLFMSQSTTRMPLLVPVSAFAFCSFNGYLQAQGLCQFIVLPHRWHYSLQFWCGLVVGLTGAAINIHSDAILRNLRANRAVAISSQPHASALSHYAIPNGGLFHWVSTPHYLGELIEWSGYCIASNYSLASVAFVCYTAANLIPRGVAHHAWYQKTFPAYPPHRKAVIPFVW